MKKLTLFLRATAGLCVACGLASAATVFDFTQAGSNYGGTKYTGQTNQYTTLTETVGGVTVTATAWSAPNTSTALVNTAVIGQYQGNGLGVCNANEGTTGCFGSAPEHQVDNDGTYDFLLFTFNTAVNLNSITLQNFGTSGGRVDLDMSYWTRASATGGAGYTIPGLSTTGGFSAENDVNYSSGTGTVTDTLTGNGVRSLLVGARVSGDGYPDFFKVQTLSVTAATPEPATFVLAGAALLALGFGRRKSGARQ